MHRIAHNIATKYVSNMYYSGMFQIASKTGVNVERRRRPQVTHSFNSSISPSPLLFKRSAIVPCVFLNIYSTYSTLVYLFKDKAKQTNELLNSQCLTACIVRSAAFWLCMLVAHITP